MDPTILAQQLASFLIPFLPYLTRAGQVLGEEAVKKFGSGAWDQAKQIWGKLHPKVDAKPAAAKSIQNIAATPEDENAKSALRSQLKQLFQEDKTLVTEMAQLIEKAQAAGVMIAVQGDALFQIFTQSPLPLSRHIRVREFQTLVNERTRGFVGRDFVFKAISGFLRGADFPSGYIVISGEPGIGKTALLAQMVKTSGCVHHFNVGSQNIRSARDFLMNVCAQLIVRYDLNYLTVPEDATKDSGFLSQLLFEVAEKEKTRRVVILVDALDEAEDVGLPSGTNQLYLPPALPDGIYFIVTTREKADYRLVIDRRKDIYLGDKDPHNLEDVRQYIRQFVREHGTKMISRIEQCHTNEDGFVDTITEHSEGNFMYLIYVLRDILDGKLTATNIGDIRDLPKGLRAYYQRHWRAMKAQDVERFEKFYQPVMCILATVREPVTVAQVAEWTKLTPIQIKDVINDWREFLNVDESEQREPLYRVYHTSFQDFLKEEVGLQKYHDEIAMTALRKIPGFLDGRTNN